MAEAKVEAKVVEAAPAQVEAAMPTQEELLAELDAARETGQFKVVAQVAVKLAAFQKAKDAAELEERQKAALALTDKVLAAIRKAIRPLYDGGELDQVDGVWYSWDFEQELDQCRLLKSAPRAPRVGKGGGGKRFNDASSASLLAKYGHELYPAKEGTKGAGLTFQQAWDADTDKNWRANTVRQKLLKREGLIQ